MPEVLHISSVRTTPALQATIQLLATELRDPRLGVATILNRAVDILLIHPIRAALTFEASGDRRRWAPA